MKRVFTILCVLWIGVSYLFAEDLLSGELPGKFTISATSEEYIHFSKGNLYRNKAMSTTWRFLDNQYDTIGAANASTGMLGSKLELFGFSSVYQNEYITVKEYGENISTSDDSYRGDFWDWGNKKIANGGNIANIWSTLSKTEWNYILTQRPNANKLQKIVTVGGIKGLLLLPDESTTTIADSYTTTTFKTAQDDDGAVFLPFAGRREGTTVDKVNTEGYYWTSTVDGDSKAYMLHLTTGTALESSPRHYGYTVRLVKRYNECKVLIKAESNNADWGTCTIEVVE